MCQGNHCSGHGHDHGGGKPATPKAPAHAHPGHVHGPDCDHHRTDKAGAEPPHVHGPDCNHGPVTTGGGKPPVVSLPKSATPRTAGATTPQTLYLNGYPITEPVGFSGSYPEDDCRFLLLNGNDAVRRTLPGATDDMVQAFLPPGEKVPHPVFFDAYEHALDRNAPRLARDVMSLAVAIRQASGEQPAVIASLARAGTPFGVLLRRALRLLGSDVPHYSVSLLRTTGIDRGALDYINQVHRGARIWFVDGWTGKGGISRHLSSSVARYSSTIPGKLVCISDLAGVSQFASGVDDYLIPSAMLDAPMNGLVSKTSEHIEATRGIALGDEPVPLHSAYIWEHLRQYDRSNQFVDYVESYFPEALADAIAGKLTLARRPQVGVARAVAVKELKRLKTLLNIEDEDRIKHGFNETLRAMQRRKMHKLLLKSPYTEDVNGIVWIAEMLGIPVEHAPDLAYECVGVCGERLEEN